MTVYIAADHGGFELKAKIINYLNQNNIEYKDMGAHELNPTDDYPDYVIPALKKVQAKPVDRAILICRNGVGVSILANKFNKIRATLSWDAKHIASSRNDDDTNVLALPADYITQENAVDIVHAWLNTNFSNETRHIRRLEKVAKYDNSSNI